MRNFYTFLLSLFISLAIFSCGGFEKVRKMTDPKKKYTAAVNYYHNKEYDKAGILFEELLPLVYGDSIQELATFYQAYCDYNTQNFEAASYHFKAFSTTFERSQFAEEAIYMAAYSLYKGTADYNLDQTTTNAAINELQSYINNYPDSKFREESANLIKELRKKLERKAFEKAKMYYKTSPFNFAALKSAVIEITNFQKDYPDSEYNEEIAYLKVLSQHDLAKSTIESKQKERFDEAIVFYQQLIDKYPKSVFVKQAESLYESSQKESERIGKIELAYRIEQDKIKKSNASKVTTGSSN
ncbi:MAG: outer membrane protein assembly factor BamD [Pseudarcicella sp.]|nr:outer membrane protein assembly factor BamD [Pseudarcicella sp.]MBP6410810.1 outer membrane protein assembly factor BamD [Pseudarcicella sp.]